MTFLSALDLQCHTAIGGKIGAIPHEAIRMVWPATRTRNSRNWLCANLAVVIAGVASGTDLAAESQDWSVIGRQGIVNLVLVPNEQARDLTAYEHQIDRLCQPAQTCFLNFYTNSKGIAVVVPLPDQIASEATATFRRSTKQGAEMFMWSCRLKVSTNECF